MPIIYRQADSNDLMAGARVVQCAMNGLRPRYGLPPMASPPPPEFSAFWLARDRQGLWVAEEDSAIVGWSFSWMHQRFWFLSQLDVVPEMQGKGLGQTLLSKALDCATQKEADRRALITFAFNTHSIGLYIRYGFFPQVPLYLMSTSTQMLADRITEDAASAYAVRPLHEVAPTEEWVDEIDEKVLGFRRSVYHDFLSQTSPKEAMAIVSATGEPTGYCYISRTGHIGPLAIEPAADLRQAIQAVMRQAIASKHQQISIILPGFSEPLVRTASKLGFRINEPLLLMANQAFGNWQCYAPRSPGHM